jgi:hypothetical protein
MQPEMRGALTPPGSSGPSSRLSQAGWNERVHWSEQVNYKRYLRRCQLRFWRLLLCKCYWGWTKPRGSGHIHRVSEPIPRGRNRNDLSHRRKRDCW